ncbi:putative disease resistance protein RGA3 [Carex rostrata]
MATASGLISSIQSISTNLLRAIRGTPSSSHQQQDPPSLVTEQQKSVRDLEKLSRMLARIQAVQQDAEEREIHDCSVRLWLAELRGVAYKAEDVLDEFYYEVLRSIVESGDAAMEAYHRDGGTKRKFAEMYTSSSIASYSFSITKVMIPDGMAEKIKGITQRFQEISNARRDLHLREEDGTRLVISTETRPPTSSHVDERAIFGREKEKENIISVLNPLNDPQFTVLPIIGMGGLGKTTLAQLVYNDSKFLQLFDKRVWVSVSEDFDLVHLTRAIIESINRTACEISELNILQDILKEKINHVSLFLVLDDVWNENTELWEHFQVALKGGKTVKILTTTRNTSVAEIMQTTSPIQLECLPDEKCWSLFKHFAFHNGEPSENKNLLEIGHCIVKKCKGSPLVTKVLGGILRYDMDEEKWREIMKSDIFKIDENGKIFTPLQLSYQKLPLHLKPCFVYLAMFPKGKRIDRDHVVRLWMAQGYINSNSSRTKKTLEEIGSEYLNELQGRSLIDFGYYNKCYVHDLIHDLARSISQKINQPVLENDNLWNSSYKINHLYLTKKHELSDFLASFNNKVIRTYVRECPRNYIDDSVIFSKITYVRALQLRNCMLPDTLSALKHLRYLFIKDDKIESLPESLCLLYHLQTLDINCHNILELPENIKSLINLRFLQLCSSKIMQLPESIYLLQNLDTLSLELCRKLKKLPRSIEQLTSLRVLKLSEDFVCNLPSGIGKLTNLVLLNGKFKVMGSDMTRGLGELRDMNRLCGLMSISGLKNVGNIEHSREANLVSKSNLHKLILSFEEVDIPCKISFRWLYGYPFFNIALSSSTNAKIENNEKIQEGVLESLQPHGNLTELEILNYRGRRFPYWLLDRSLMSKLTTLTLHFHMELTFLLPLLDQLPHLKSLKIYMSCNTVTNVEDELLAGLSFANDLSKQPAPLVSFSSFNNMLNLGDEPCLKKLTINNCSKLWEVTIPQKVEVLEVDGCGCQEINFSAHSELKRLSIINCRKLITIYYKSGDLPFIESISLSGCPNLSMLSAIPQEMKQLHISDCGIQEINFSSLSKLQKVSIFDCRELLSIYYKIGDLSFLGSISLSGCPKLLIFSAILEEKKQMDSRNSDFQSEIQNVSRGRVSLFNCPKLRIFSAIPAVELDTLKIAHCGIREIILPSRCQLLEIHNCPELISVQWKDGDTISLPLVKFVDCPQLKLLKIPKEVEELQIKSCGTREIFFSSQSMVRSVHIFGCRKLSLVHWMDGDVPFLKDIFFEGCSELISLQFLQGDLPLLEKFAIKSCPQFNEVLTVPYQLKELKIVDCLFPEIHLLPQSKLRRLIISECVNLTAIKGLQTQFPTGDVSQPMMEMVDIRNCRRMDFGTQGNSYFYQVKGPQNSIYVLSYF